MLKRLEHPRGLPLTFQAQAAYRQEMSVSSRVPKSIPCNALTPCHNQETRKQGAVSTARSAYDFPRVYLFRPAYIYPVEPRKEPNLSYRLLRVIYPVFRVLLPNRVIPADDLARVMVDIAVRETQETGGQIFENRDIRAMVE